MSKSPLTSQEVLAEVHRQLRCVPLLQLALEGNDLFELTVARPRNHDRDCRGRSWNIDGFRTGFVFWPQCETEFRVIVDRLRDRYDLG